MSEDNKRGRQSGARVVLDDELEALEVPVQLGVILYVLEGVAARRTETEILAQYMGNTSIIYT